MGSVVKIVSSFSARSTGEPKKIGVLTMSIYRRNYIAKLAIDLFLGSVLCTFGAFYLRFVGNLGLYASQVSRYTLISSVPLLAAELLEAPFAFLEGHRYTRPHDAAAGHDLFRPRHVRAELFRQGNSNRATERYSNQHAACDFVSRRYQDSLPLLLRTQQPRGTPKLGQAQKDPRRR